MLLLLPFTSTYMYEQLRFLMVTQLKVHRRNSLNTATSMHYSTEQAGTSAALEVHKHL